jgi:hypothetical protein
MTAERFEAKSYRNRPRSFNRRFARLWTRVGEGGQLGEHQEAEELKQSATRPLVLFSPTSRPLRRLAVG